MAKKATPPADRPSKRSADKVDRRDRSNGSGKVPRKSAAAQPEPGVEAGPPAPEPLKNKVYIPELSRLQVELVKLQEWIRHEGLKVVVIFEGRDAAGKGGVIKTHHPEPEPAGLPRRRPRRADGA